MIGGRKAWIAWPAGLACAGVVAGLAWLAAPGVPGAVTFAGDLLRTGSAVTAAESGHTARAELTDDCRSLYPDGLWARLSWRPHVVLDQSRDAPVTAATAVRDALQPAVRMTCTWRTESGATVATTLATVDAAAPAIAQAGLQAQGFTCTAAGDGIRCTKTRGDTAEEQVVRDGLWLATVETGWHPDGYTDALVHRLWPG
ncbi:hypothetical protein [Microbacterium luticocti]|uniref:hypothetical protein n=1 Tax=Microbacterium luticocti TaxID=451764 RepID=UPI0004287EE6|nr:hypothetical protein [Microbacterium luticocti]